MSPQTTPTRPRATLVLALALLALPLAASPVAAACETIAIVTLGEPGYPAEGVYYEENCTPGPSGEPGAQADVGSANGALVPSQSIPIPAIFILGIPVPGTGTTHTTPDVGGPVSYRQAAPLGDVGIATCLNTLGFTCTYTSTALVRLVCQDVDTGSVNLVNGYSVRAACTLA